MSTYCPTPLLISPSQANSLPEESRLFVDTTWFMPNDPRNPREEFEKIRLPDAQFLDIDQVSAHTEENTALGLKHMMPSSVTFAEACEDMGIKNDTHVILYDIHGILSAPRALFMFRAFSHIKSSVLDGGLPGWINEGYETEIGPPKTPRAHGTGSYTVPVLNESVVRSYIQITNNSNKALSDSTADIVVDTRPHGRYLGTDPEPRGLPSGHIPHSFSMPFTCFLLPNQLTNRPSFLNTHPDTPFKTYTTLRPLQELSEELHRGIGDKHTKQILSGERGLVVTCASGMTAAIPWLAVSRIWESEGKTSVRDIGLYDESWTGYVGRKAGKINKGEETN